jgi:hypothetical protein
MPGPPVDAASSDPNIAAVLGTQTGEEGTGVVGIGDGNGVFGQSKGPKGFAGVRGQSDGGPGVSGASNGSVGVDAMTQTGPAALRAIHAGNGPGVIGACHGSGYPGVWGDSNSGPGVSGTSGGSVGVDAKTQTGPAALRAIHAGNGPGVIGACHGIGGSGVWGESNSGPGVSGTSTGSVGVDAKTQHGPAGLRAVHTGAGIGVLGACDSGDGVFGRGHRGVRGESPGFQGVSGWSSTNAGVVGESDNFSGVWAISHNPNNGGLFATNDKGGPAAVFGGDVLVFGKTNCTGTVTCFDIALSNADCAEEFEISEIVGIEPGTLMSFGLDGTLRISVEAYDTRVAGVISGAGDYKPGIVLDRKAEGRRAPIALVGKVFCKVDTTNTSIEVGDLLTTSATPGHAMKATDRHKAFGSVIGKALRSHSEGRGLIPIFVALQ